jgi:hypothetical protein
LPVSILNRFDIQQQQHHPRQHLIPEPTAVIACVQQQRRSIRSALFIDYFLTVD